MPNVPHDNTKISHILSAAKSRPSSEAHPYTYHGSQDADSMMMVCVARDNRVSTAVYELKIELGL